MKTGISKKLLSVLLAVLTVITMAAPGFSALAAEIDQGGGVIGVYDIEIFYEDGTLVPAYQEDGETAYIEYMYEGDKKQFTYQLIDCTMPDNGYVKWTSDTPTVCDVTEDGIVRAFDSSKGAAVRLWIDNEVATVPLIGSCSKPYLKRHCSTITLMWIRWIRTPSSRSLRRRSVPIPCWISTLIPIRAS